MAEPDGRPGTRMPGPPDAQTAGPDSGLTLRLSLSETRPHAAHEVIVVLDTGWTPSDDGATGVISLRDIAERVLSRRDMIPEASALLDPWVDAAGLIDLMTYRDVSFWYGARLRHWLWLAEQILWLAILDEILGGLHDVRRIVIPGDVDDALVDAARMIGSRDGLEVDLAPDHRRVDQPSVDGAHRSLWRRLTRQFRSREQASRLRTVRQRVGLMRSRLERIADDPARRLLVVQAHVRQRVDTASGPRSINVYLGPIIERLRGTILEPFELDIRAAVADDDDWSRLRTGDQDRTLSSDLFEIVIPTGDPGREPGAAVEKIASTAVPLRVSGVDLGPELANRVATRLSHTWGRDIAAVERIRAVLRRTHPAGILLADEYHRQDWLAAARAEGLPVAAVQHGVIYRWHTGYIHRSRPASLALPGRTYVFGSWERDLLLSASVYRPDEVVVGGSPRLDLVQSAGVDRERLRSELGVAPEDRLLVLSGTWGRMYRRFQYPIALARLFDRPIDHLHVVVKLHPAERDDGPYRGIIDGVAAARGFTPPRVTTVQDIDLYRLLSAADAHLGIHSTLITEAVVTGTPNLLATGLAGADLLGYVKAGVAIPVCDGADLVEALDRPRDEAMPAPAREAFMRRHFEPGASGQSIADNLLSWLT